MTYTPDTAYGSEENEIKIQCKITYEEENEYSYGGSIEALFTLTTDTISTSTAVTEWEIDGDDLTCIQLCDLKLPNLTAYNAFNDGVLTESKVTKLPTFTFTFSEAAD